MAGSMMSLNLKRSTREENPVSRVDQAKSVLYTELLDTVILKWAGKDATVTYDPIHPPDTLDKLVSPTNIPELQDLKVGKS